MSVKPKRFALSTISFSCSGLKYLRPASIETIFRIASFSSTWLAFSVLGVSLGRVTLDSSEFMEALSVVVTDFSATVSSFGSSVTGFSAGASAATAWGLTSSLFLTTASGKASLLAWASTGATSWTPSPALATAGPVVATRLVGAACTSSAETTCPAKQNPTRIDAAPIESFRIEKRCFLLKIIIKSPFKMFRFIM